MNSDYLFYLGFFLAFFLSLIFSKRWFRSFSTKSGQSHHIHVGYVNRFGGWSLVLGLFLAGIFLDMFSQYIDDFFWKIYVIAVAMFLVGSADDLREHISPKKRLVVMAVIGFAATKILSPVTHIEPQFAATLLRDYPILPYVLSVIFIIGLVNSYNIIDGLNGLLAGVFVMQAAAVVIILGELSYGSNISACVLLYVGLVSGVAILNFPFGKIFMGDGGAYFLGTVSGLFSIYINEIDSGVSSWFFLAINIYPATETIVSISRRWLGSTGVARADNGHLHNLVYRVVCHKLRGTRKPFWALNSLSTVLVLIMPLTATVFAIKFFRETDVLIVLCIVFVLFYCMIYCWINHWCKKQFRPYVFSQ